MADIEIRCEKCAATSKVSEFVDESTLRCSGCGAPLKRPANIPSSQPRRKLTFKQMDNPVDAEGNPLTGAASLFKAPRFTKKRKSEWTPGQHALSWVLFIVIGAGMGYLRYGNILKPQQMAIMTQYAPIVVAAFYILTILKAFQDNVYNGILCILIPPYALFYILVLCDDFYMRAVTAGLLVGLGQDTGEFVYTKAVEISQAVTTWIRSGG